MRLTKKCLEQAKSGWKKERENKECSIVRGRIIYRINGFQFCVERLLHVSYYFVWEVYTSLFVGWFAFWLDTSCWLRAILGGLVGGFRPTLFDHGTDTFDVLVTILGVELSSESIGWWIGIRLVQQWLNGRENGGHVVRWRPSRLKYVDANAAIVVYWWGNK